MTSKSGADDDDERFNRLYERHRTEGIRYAAQLIAGPMRRNKHLLGVEAEELFDEAMELYYKAEEYASDHDQHEAHIKRRVRLVYITWLRRERTQRRRPPGGRVKSLDRPVGESDDGSESVLELRDPRADDPERLVDLEDVLNRIEDADERLAARSRYEGMTFEEIADATGVSAETARQRVRRAAQELGAALDEEDP